MLTIKIRRSVAALAVTAGLLAAGAPASHAYSSGVSQTGTAFKAPGNSHGSDATQPGSHAVELEIPMISNVKAKTAKGAKGKRVKGERAHTYDVQSSHDA